MADSTLQRRLAAILSADAEGYSRLMSEDDAATVRMLRTCREAATRLVQAHGGRVVDAPGDNLLAEFGSAVDAVEAAVEIQRQLDTCNAELPEERRMRFRIGVNLGDVIVEEGRLYGDGVNVAARIEKLAEAGGICVSGKVHDEVQRKLKLDFVDLGDHELKNIGAPVRVWRIQPPAAPGAARARAEPARQAKPSILVLPFVNMSGVAEQEFFADGLTEDLIHALSLQSFYRVLSRSSTFAFKGQNLSARLIAREIDATYLIQGSVRRGGNKLRVTAELIAPETGAQLWAGRYDRDMGDLFALQDELTTSLSGALAPEIFRAEASAPSRASSTDLTAWDRFLRGLSHYYKQTKPDFEASIAYFREAITLDPSLAIARAYLGTIMVQGSQYGWIPSTRELWMEAIELAESSVRLDPRSSFAFSILAFVHAMTGNHEAAMEAGRRAVELNPYDMGARGVLGCCHLAIGEHRQAIELFSTAVQRGNSDPRYQWAALLAFSHYLSGQYDASLSWAREALYLNPNHLQVLAVRAAALAQLGRDEEAAKATGVLLNSYPGLTVEKHLRNFRWKELGDIARYREGLLKAGVPSTKLVLVDAGRRTANS